MKVIFLDIDGVLNSARSFIANHPRGLPTWKTMDERNIATIDPIAVKLVNELAHRLEAEIVVSSSHRKWFYMRSYSYEIGPTLDRPALITYMHGLGIEKEVIDATPVLSGEGRIRGDEIALWLSKNSGVEKYVILDDDGDMLPIQKEKHFVQTDNYNGFMFEDYQKAELILGQNETTNIFVPSRY